MVFHDTSRQAIILNKVKSDFFIDNTLNTMHCKMLFTLIAIQMDTTPQAYGAFMYSVSSNPLPSSTTIHSFRKHKTYPTLAIKTSYPSSARTPSRCPVKTSSPHQHARACPVGQLQRYASRPTSLQPTRLKSTTTCASSISSKAKSAPIATIKNRRKAQRRF